MNPVTIRQLIHKEEVNSARAIKNYFIESWVKNIISPVEMLNVLRKSLEDPGYHVTLDEAQKFANTSSYELKEKAIEKLIEAFSRVFPNVHGELEKVRKELPESLRQKRIEAEQVSCKHEFQLSHKHKEKHFKCSKCKRLIILPVSTLANKEIVEKLNKIKPPASLNCIKFGHQWENRTGYQVDRFTYACAICNIVAVFLVEDERKLEKIEKDVSEELGSNIVSLCNDIEYFFHINSNKKVTINDFIKFFEKFRLSIKINDLNEFTKAVKAVLRILINCEYIDEVPGDNASTRMFIRKMNLDDARVL